MQNSMKEKCPNISCILDCVELKVIAPLSLILHNLIYSDYKSYTKVKALVGVAPAGRFTLILSVFLGSMSNKDIVGFEK